MIDYTIEDVTGYLGWSHDHQKKIAVSVKPAVKIIWGRKTPEGRLRYGYTKKEFKRLIKAGGYREVVIDGKTMLAHKKFIKEKP